VIKINLFKNHLENKLGCVIKPIQNGEKLIEFKPTTGKIILSKKKVRWYPGAEEKIRKLIERDRKVFQSIMTAEREGNGIS